MKYLVTGGAGLYLIRNVVNDKAYVGSTKNLMGRKKSHFQELRKGIHINRHLQNAWNKYGEQNFHFDILFLCGPEELLFFEQRALDYYKKGKLYNISLVAGSNLGVKYSEESKRKMSLAMTGKRHSEETRKKLSESHTGQRRTHSEETKRKMSETKRGKAFSEEHRKRLSEARRKNGSPRWGTHHSEETKRRLSETSRSWTRSEEYKKKLAAAIKRSWVVRRESL